VFFSLEERQIAYIIAWRRLRSRENPSDVLTVKDRIDVEGPLYLRVLYKRLRAMVESFNGRVKSRLDFSQFTWQVWERLYPYVSGILRCLRGCDSGCAFGRPELQYSIAYFA